MNARDYLTEQVVYGGETMTRAAMIADLQRWAATVTDDQAAQRRLVDRYLQGFEASTTDLLDPEGSGYVPEPPWDDAP